MPRLAEKPRHARRDADGPYHRSSRHGDDSRHRHSQRSLSPQRSQKDLNSTRKGQDSSGAGGKESSGRASRRHRSPHRNHGSSHRVKKPVAAANVTLPFSARPLSKEDLTSFQPLFAEYLFLQKQRDIYEMDDREIRGRWKSFVGKWNSNELAEGWYDPEVFQRAQERALHPELMPAEEEPTTQEDYNGDDAETDDDAGEGDDDDDGEDYGPTLPGEEPSRRAHKAGVAVPSLQDLALRDEMIEESREADLEALRAARKSDRALQKERLEELVPRAEAGTRERKLEKRQEVNEKMRQFREKSPGVEVGEKDLMGGGDSLEEYKRDKDRDRKRKSERFARREELARARKEEIEVKRRAWQRREDKTVSMLRELAKQRFG